MIPLVRKRQGSAIPKDFLGGKLIEKHVDLVDLYFNSVESGKPMAFTSGKWKSAKAKVRADSAKKCAYCEASTSVVAHGDVEHFRPKSIYWWLAYDFDNYLFACQICNQLHKKDFFPVSPQEERLPPPDMPALRPTTKEEAKALAETLAFDASISSDNLVRLRLVGEDPDLVNPYLEDPTSLFVFEVDDINQEVWLRPGTEARSQRAYEASMKYLGLNREELRRDRYSHYCILAIIKLAKAQPTLSAAVQREIEKNIARLSDVRTPFAGMSRFFIAQWGLAP